MTFDAADYTRFDPKECRVSREVLQIIAKDVCEGYFGLKLVGVDMIVEEGTGNVYLIDINYFSSYKGLPHMDVERAFKELIVDTHQANVEAMEKAGVHL